LKTSQNKKRLDPEMDRFILQNNGDSEHLV